MRGVVTTSSPPRSSFGDCALFFSAVFIAIRVISSGAHSRPQFLVGSALGSSDWMALPRRQSWKCSL